MAICPMPWFPIFAAEMLSDEDFAAWSPAARGCWLVLISRCWKDGSIPSDLSTLARLCNEDAQAMLEHWKSIGPKFQGVPEVPDRLFGIRTEQERQLAIERAEKLKKRGEAGATARWAKANTMLKHVGSNASSCSSPSPSPSLSQEGTLAREGSRSGPVPFPDDVPFVESA